MTVLNTLTIYRVSRISEWDYGEYSSFVCFARNEEQAKNFNPSFVDIYNENFEKYLDDPPNNPFYMDWENIDEYWIGWVKSKDDLQVTKLGTSEPTNLYCVKAGIILASYHAG